VTKPNGFATGTSSLFENLVALLDPTDFSKLLAAHPLRAFFRISSNLFSGRSLSCLISRLANVFWKRRENLYAVLALHFGYFQARPSSRRGVSKPHRFGTATKTRHPLRTLPARTGFVSPVQVSGKEQGEQPTRLRVWRGESPRAVNCLFRTASISGACGGNEA
jgi:hypothetical protein